MVKQWGPTAQGTISSLLGQTMMEDNIKKECVNMYDWVTLLYPRNWHNTVRQLYFNKKKYQFPCPNNSLGLVFPDSSTVDQTVLAKMSSGLKNLNSYVPLKDGTLTGKGWCCSFPAMKTSPALHWILFPFTLSLIREIREPRSQRIKVFSFWLFMRWFICPQALNRSFIYPNVHLFFLLPCISR